VKAGNGAPVVERELVVEASHGNTVSWCCTSFANSRDRRTPAFLVRLRRCS
jgi:hypothetical protein